MGFRNKLSTRQDHVLSPRLDRFDPFLTDVELRNSYRYLVDGDWRRLEAFLEDSPKAWLFTSIITSELVGIETVTFARWVEVMNSPRARSYEAGGLIRDAYEMREMAKEQAVIPSAAVVPAARATHHDPSLARHMEMVLNDAQQLLVQAERLLYDVVRSRPGLSEPWVFLLESGRGIGLRLEELRQRFDNAHSRDPFRPDACRQYLEGLLQKSGGSQEATFDFARWIEHEAPPDAPARMCLPVAHIEQGLFDYKGTNLAAYLNQEEVVAELVTSLESFLRATPSPAPTETLPALNAYALAVSADSPTTAHLVAEVFDRIGSRPTAYPWSLYKEGIPGVFGEIQSDQLRFSSRY